MNKMTYAMRLLGYIASNVLVMTLIAIGRDAIVAVPLVIPLIVVLTTVTVSDKP